MSGWPRTLAGIAAGLVAWTVVATALNLGMRLAWPAYAAVEKALAFTLGMQAARLVVGAAATLAGGLAAAWLSRRSPPWLAGLLLVIFVPVHYRLLDRFPIWYHVVFLVSLPLLTLAGAALRPRTA